MDNELVFRCVFHSECIDTDTRWHTYRFREDRSKFHFESTAPAEFKIELGEPGHPVFKVGDIYKLVLADPF